MIVKTVFKTESLAKIEHPVGVNINDNLPLIKEMAEQIQRHFFPAKINLVCMGSSGAIIAGIIASLIRINGIIHIKKEGESSHCSGFFVEPDSFNIFVDDFISSGFTLSEVAKKFNIRRGYRLNAVVVSGGVPYTSRMYTYDLQIDTLICRDFDEQAITILEEEI